MRTLVLLSGGMDSTTALFQAISQLETVSAVSFDYGQRHKKEIEAAKRICDTLMVNHTVLDLTGAFAAFRGSALTGTGDVPHGHYEDESMKRTVVPNRNMTLLSLAAGLAISIQADRIVYAAHAGDHAIYPDCRPEFYEAVAKAVELGNYDPPKLEAPFINMTKADIVTVGNKIGVPFKLTWSCYEGGDTHCGQCGTCQERRAAFIEAGVKDPTIYSPEGLQAVPEVKL